MKRRTHEKQTPFVLRLWSDEIPGAMGDGVEDSPEITIHLPPPEIASGAATVICPGGGYGALMVSYEGHEIAQWLNRFGIAGMVLKYRISPYRHPAPMWDGRRAMRLVRANSKKWRLDPERIGIMGFSAGGHLASTIGTHFDEGEPTASDPVERQTCHPNFMILIYPVISMSRITHFGSKINLLGENPKQTECEFLSNENHVSARTPPTFLAHAKTDRAVAVENSSIFYAALKKQNVPAEFLALAEGEHGLGAGKGRLWAAWQTQCALWMKSQGLTGK